MYCMILHFHAFGRNERLPDTFGIPSVRRVKPVFLDIIGALKEKQKKSFTFTPSPPTEDEVSSAVHFGFSSPLLCLRLSSNTLYFLCLHSHKLIFLGINLSCRAAATSAPDSGLSSSVPEGDGRAAAA